MMVSSTLSLWAPLFLAAFSNVSKVQASSYDPFNNPYDPSKDASCLLTPEQQADVLLAHNELRALHVDTGNLTWSDSLAERAAWWACSYNCNPDDFGDAPSDGYFIGSNAFMGNSGNFVGGAPVRAVYAWYEEIAHYNYSHPGYSDATGHFTQVVWRSTKEVGCAAKYCGPYWGYFVECQYDPAGNVIGEFPENVMPLKASTSSSVSTKPKSSFTSSATSKKSTSSNSNGSAIDATDRSTTTARTSTSSNVHGSAIDATDRSTTTARTSTSSNVHGSAIDATDRSTITSKKSTSSNVHGSAIDATDRSTTTARTSTSSNVHGSAIDATDRSTITSKKSTSSNVHGSAIDATDRSTATTTTSTDYTKYALTPEEQAAVVLAHNKLRALHVDTGNLTWSNTLAEYAEKYAAIYDCSSGKLVHSHGPYGENLALGFPNAVAAVDAWYSEIRYYNYSHPGFSMRTGHFTQVVWRSTKEVGCAVKYCGSYYRDYVVCEYAPPGNYEGEFPENVMPLKASVSNSVSSTPKSSFTSSTTSKKSTSSNNNGSAIDATDRSTITSKKSTSSNVHGSAIDATDKSTTTGTSTPNSGNGSAIDATDRSTTTGTSTPNNSNGSAIDATDRSTTTGTSTPNNSNGSAIDATDRSTTTGTSTPNNSNGSAIDATDRSTTTGTSTPNNSNGSAIGANGKTHAAGETASAKTNVAHSVTTTTVKSTHTVDVTECPICSLSTATTSFSSQNSQTILHSEPVLRVSTVYTTDGVVITTYTTSCPENAKPSSVTASAATAAAHLEVSMESAHANVVPSIGVVTSASNSAGSVSIAKYEGLAASLTSDVLFSAILMALIHLI